MTTEPKWNSLPGPEDITRRETGNGIVVLSRENFNSPSVVFNGYLGAGSLFDPDERLGLALFTSQALMRGTANHTQQQIYDRLESLGASLGFGAGTHSVTFSGRALAEDFPLILDTLAEVLQTPVFPAEEVERLRAQLLTSLALREQDTEQRAGMGFEEIIYAGHPYSRPEEGTPAGVQAIQPADLADFHRRRYGPKGMVIAVVGALKRQSVADEVEKRFGAWKDAPEWQQPEIPPAAPLQSEVRKHIPLKEKYQTDVIMGTLGPHRLSEDFLPATLGNHVLGQFGMMGRIGESVREKAGLAYHASSSVNAGQYSGTWEVSAGVAPGNVDQAVELIKKEIDRFTAEPLSEEEIAESTSNLTGQLPLAFETNSGVAGALVRLERFQLGFDYYRRYPDLLRAITAEDILQTARRWLDSGKLAVVSSGQ
jgi:zinc protease